MVKEMSSIAFLLSLIGGVLIFVAGLVSSVWFLFGGTVWGGFSDI